MYRCLLIDHDDTCVDSTRHIHYPAHLEILKQMRPEHNPESLEGWYEKNFNPGVFAYYTEELGFSPREMTREFNIWRSYTTTRVPDFFPGMVETLKAFKKNGGAVVVVSHSEEELIRRDYANGADGLEPDLIFGWHHDAEKRKPHPWPALEALKILGVSPGETAVLDDLSPGIDMARRAGVDALAAGWGHRVASIEQEMRRRCKYYFTRVDDFAEFLLG